MRGLNRKPEATSPIQIIWMQRESFDWFVSATSVYAFLGLMTLMKTRVIDYSPFDLFLGVVLGLLVVMLILALLAGVAIIIQETASRPHQPWF